MKNRGRVEREGATCRKVESIFGVSTKRAQVLQTADRCVCVCVRKSADLEGEGARGTCLGTLAEVRGALCKLGVAASEHDDGSVALAGQNRAEKMQRVCAVRCDACRLLVVHHDGRSTVQQRCEARFAVGRDEVAKAALASCDTPRLKRRAGQRESSTNVAPCKQP